MAEAKAEEQQQGQEEPSDGASGHAEDRSPEERLPVEEGEHHTLPEREACEEILRKMLLIRRFEERARACPCSR